VVKAVHYYRLSASGGQTKVRRIFKYALSAVAAMILSLTLAGVAAAQCTLETSEA
jgi:lipopolysaccharide/colanic/teichoic acid biosynthesis glycosyltransferase